MLSLNRNFSAPVRARRQSRRRTICASWRRDDSDPFNRWQAVQIAGDAPAGRQRGGDPLRRRAAPATTACSTRFDADPRRRLARAGVRGAGADAAERSRHRPRDRARRRSRCDLRGAHRVAPSGGGQHLAAALQERYRALADSGPYRPDADGAGRRALRNACLDLLVAARAPGAIALAAEQYRDADNMTDRMAALTTLSLRDVPERAAALDDFYERYPGQRAGRRQMAVRCRPSIPEPATLARVKALDRASGVLDEQSQSRARAVRRVRDVEPDAVQSCRRRRLRSPDRHRARARSRRIRRSPRACSPRSRAGACSNPAAARSPKQALRKVAAQPSLSRDVSDIVIARAGRKLTVLPGTDVAAAAAAQLLILRIRPLSFSELAKKPWVLKNSLMTLDKFSHLNSNAK